MSIEKSLISVLIILIPAMLGAHFIIQRVSSKRTSKSVGQFAFAAMIIAALLMLFAVFLIVNIFEPSTQR